MKQTYLSQEKTKNTKNKIRFPSTEVVNLLKRVQRIMYNNNVSLKSMNVVFLMIYFAIQKDLPAQFVVLLPFMCNYHEYIYIYILYKILNKKICCSILHDDQKKKKWVHCVLFFFTFPYVLECVSFETYNDSQ
jgi:hypothetical protein